MSFIRVSACVFAVATSLAGCVAASGPGNVEYAGEVHVTSPELVELPSGVQVVADADEPLFYSEGFYWGHRDNHWLRSSCYRGGFVSVDHEYVPERVRTISHPQSYAQYRRHHGRTLEARATPKPQRSKRHPPGGPLPPPTYIPERGLPPEPDRLPDREEPEPPHVPVAPTEERDRVPPQSPQQRGPMARPEDRTELDPINAREQERGIRSPIRSEDQPGADERDRKADEKQDTKAPDK